MGLLRKAVAVSCLAVSVLSLTGCGFQEASSGKVIFASHTEATSFTGKLYEGITAKVSAQGGTVELLTAGGDANLQVDQLNEALAEKPAAIILLAVDGYALIPMVEKANEAGVPVIATSRDLNGGVFAKVRSDEYQAGKLQGEYMAKHLPPNAKIVYLMGQSNQSSAIQRWSGFKENCLDKRSDIQLLAKTDSEWSEAEALKNMTLWLQVYPQIDGVIAANDTMALGALKALRAAGLNGKVLLSGVDAKDAAVKAVASGEMAQTVKQDAEKTVEAINGILQKALSGNVPTDDVKIPFVEITKENAATVK